MAYSSSSSSRSFKYDVFLSFRGEDTRKTFVDHLHTALQQRLIRTYKDDITLPRGESVGPALLESIEESHIAVIVFSKNYADSSWCLDELVHIMKCKEEMGLTVIPVFYDVDPSEVRYQKRKFGEAFSKQEMKNVTKSESWRKALVDASYISGWEPKNVASGHESAAIKEIVDTIFNRLFPLNLYVDEKLVGMRDRLQDLLLRLKIWSGGVLMLGIWGLGGGGKTTLATSLYTEISSQFDGHCIIESIREESHKRGLKRLQEDILSAVFKTKVQVHSVAEGKRKIKSMLCHRNVLVILDDVDDLEQLEALAGSHNWFGDGSRIIITTRDEHLLRTHRVDDVSPVTLLSHEEAIWLFNAHAYNKNKHVRVYKELSSQVVSYAAGLPLALKVLGSFLYDKDEKDWMSTLDRLKDIPERDIMEKLKISFHGLKPEEKNIFLDIACFFRHRRKDDAVEILDACGFHPDIGITVLIQKSLITIDSYGYFDMHDLIQEMGHYIVRGEHPNNPEKHSRLWKYEEIRNMCLGDTTMENDKIEAIRDFVPVQFFKFISNMKKLRWIRVIMCNDIEAPNFISTELRYINWAFYPASPFPDSFQPMNLVVLKMNYSFQKELWRSHKLLPQLKVLQLHNSRKLVSTPNFDGLPCLQKLELCSCDDLEEIHPSIGSHRSLTNITVSDCPNLRMFPTIFKMEKLKLLEIYFCHESLEFPDIQSNMESLVELSLNGIGIEGLMSSIGERCTSLISLHFYYCLIIKSKEINFDGLKHLKDFRIRGNTQHGEMPLDLFTEVFPQLTHRLQRLDLVDCCLEDGEIPSAIGEMSNLQELNLNDNNFSKLHFSISQLTRLKLLNLSCCKRLLELPQLPSSLAILLANKCDSLTHVGDFYVDCKRLWCASLICSNMAIDRNRILQSMLQGETAENQCVILQLQGLEIPKGFTPCLRDGSKCTLQLPENWCSDFCGFLMCAVVKNDSGYFFPPTITIKRVTGGLPRMDSEDDVVWKESVGDEITCVGYFPFASLRHTNWWDSTYKKISFSIKMDTFTDRDNNFQVIINACSGFGVRLIRRKGGSGPTETSAKISTDSSGISDGKDDDTPGFRINGDSKYFLMISPRRFYGNPTRNLKYSKYGFSSQTWW
ncbi:toll/interleukin-1 receptor (TIR) domain-containing protein [Artemisia annua]|uniref:ADP-ribosyl cyclase/cyclic ADP-ribose hydrolase n=1 Tax=Artemisia annua TaxID=35608 RepID=A0A2U1MY85_ARTAN|nr:toll/interleukin-1 receptor (TIR) domain-containing protein [Artemisia annua]